jgi:hypothetical protein
MRYERRDWKTHGLKKPGKPRKYDYAKIKAEIEKGGTLHEIAKRCGCKHNTVWLVKHGHYID